MMKTSHTPGPWTAKNTSGAGLGIWVDLSAALGEKFSKDFPIYGSGSLNSPKVQIAYEQWVQFPSNEWEAMQEANARLIAAAPDLLEALCGLADECELAGHGTDKDFAWPTRMKAARAAINKALGV